MRRTLVRIAHEIVEKQRRPSSSRSSASTAAAPCSPRGCSALVAELSDDGRPARRHRHRLLPRRPRQRGPRAPVVHASHLDFPIERAHGRDRRRRPLHRPHRARRDRGAVRLRPARSGCSSPCSPTAATASCRSAPTTSARTCRPRAASASTSASRSSTASTRSTITAARRRRRRMRHLLSIERPRPRGDRAHPRPRRVVRRGLGPRDQEGPGAARPDRRQPLLRGLDPHRVELRAGRQAAVAPTSSTIRSRGLVGRQGRVAEGHRPDAVGLRPGRDRRSARPHVGAARAGRALDAGARVVNAGDGKHEHPTQALLDVYTLRRRLGALDGTHDLDRRRRRCTRASPARTSSPSRRWAPR